MGRSGGGSQSVNVSEHASVCLLAWAGWFHACLGGASGGGGFGAGGA